MNSLKRMKTYYSLITSLSLLILAQTAMAQNIIILAPGHQKIISAPEITRAAIANPKVADVKALSKSGQVIVTGISVGSTDLEIWSKDGKRKNYLIRVSKGSRNLRKEVKTLLKGIEGIRIKTIGNKLIIDGQIYRGQDLNRIEKVMEMYPSVVNLTRINAQALEYFAQQINESLRLAKIEGVEVRGAGDTIFLEGEVSKKSEIEQAERIAASVFSKVKNHIKEGVSIERLILVDIKIAEVRKSSLADIGLNWPGSIDANGRAVFTSGGASAASIALGQNTTVSLRSLIEKGSAKILSNPKLLCRNGTPASFLAGGEIPIRLVSERTASITFKPYGVFLNVTAWAGRGDRVSLDIEVKISDLDAASALDGIPGILEHRVKTAANLRFGDTIVLAGLIENRSHKNVKKIPFLGHIPIIGELFKSRAFQRSESEFLIFLTPFPGEAGSHVHQKQLESMNKGMDRAKKEIKFSILD